MRLRLPLPFLLLVALPFVVACEAAAPPRDRGSPPRTPAIAAEPGRAPTPPTAPPPVADSEEWNGEQIAWWPYEEGLAEAARRDAPILLVVYTTWCGHCRNYRQVFRDPRIVERSRQFVMIRVDQDQHPEVGSRFALDGRYIPRTFFLGPDGSVAPEVDAGRDRYRYFFDENDPSSLLRGMASATERFAS